MAQLSHFIRVSLLLTSIFHASDNKHVFNVGDLVIKTGNQEVDDVLSQIPIPEGTDLNRINITTIKIRLCTDMKAQMESLNQQLQETTQRNSLLDKEAIGLKREVRQLNIKLATCSSTLAAVTGSYQTQLQIKMNNLLDVINSETFTVLKIMVLTRDLAISEKKIDLAVKSNKNYTEIERLQRDLDQKLVDLEAKKQLIDRDNTTLTLIMQIITLQNQIWDLDQTEPNTGADLHPDRRILDLQEQLDKKINELKEKQDAFSDVLELISVHTKISVLEKRIRVITEQSRSQIADAQRQLREKTVQLKNAIMLLKNQENNKELTKQILRLQVEVEQLENLIRNGKETEEVSLTEALKVEKIRETVLQRKLEGADYATAQLIMKIINIMEELRAQRETGTGQPIDILTLLQEYKHKYSIAQTEIKNLHEKLHRVREDCSGLEEKYKVVKTKLEEKIATLNQTDNPKALVLTVINLQGEINALKDQISTSTDADLISKLQRKLLEKQEELNSRTAEVQRLIDNPQTILRVISLQNEIWDLQKSPNGTTDIIKGLQNRVDVLIGEINDTNLESTKQMMKIIALQSQVEYLQKLLSKAEMIQNSKVTELTNEYTAKERELKQLISELTEKDKKNVLILEITELQNKLRKLEKEKEKQTEDKATSATVSKLKEQLKVKEEENQYYQALIKTLQSNLNQTDAQCSVIEQKVKELQDDLNSKIEELASKSNSVTSLTLQISVLTAQLEEMKEQLKNSVSKSKVEELQGIIDEMTTELQNKTKQLKKRSTQAQRLLQIIVLQVEIDKHTSTAANDTDYAKILTLQEHLTELIDGIQDKDNENTKLIFQILSHRDEILRLENQEKRQLEVQTKQIKDLENELLLIRDQIKRKTFLLESSTTMVANLSAQILELHEKIQPLEDELSNLKETYAENLAELQERVNITKSQLEDVELQLKNSNAKNFNLMMEITDLRAKLKKAQRQISKAAEKSITDLEQQLKTQTYENKNLENKNKDLKQEVEDLKVCCTDNTQCDGIKRELQQSMEEADHLHRQLQDKDAFIHQLQRNIEEQSQDLNKLQEDYNNLQRKFNVEDETIYPLKITMDPETAHPRLALSADRTEVYTTSMLQVEDNPGRFDAVLAVLGATGFSSGKHYWEVSVAEKSCYHIGMASESAPRKGSLSFRPSNGFWTIVLNKQGQLKALDRRPITIQAETQPITVGILLDYKKGEISFYDAGIRSHMYSFSGQRFIDKIYPFINYCVEGGGNATPLVVKTPGSTDWIK